MLDKKNAAHKNSARLHRETNEPLHTWRHVLMLWKISPYTLSRVVINLQIPQWFALKLSAAIFRLSLLLIPIFLYFINKLNMMNFRFFCVEMMRFDWFCSFLFEVFDVCTKCLRIIFELLLALLKALKWQCSAKSAFTLNLS